MSPLGCFHYHQSLQASASTTVVVCLWAAVGQHWRCTLCLAVRLKVPLTCQVTAWVGQNRILAPGMCVCVCVFVRVCVSYSQGWPKPYSCTRDVCVFVCGSLTARVGQNRILAPEMCVCVCACACVCLLQPGLARTVFLHQGCVCLCVFVCLCVL
jgi:hypothetical protein